MTRLEITSSNKEAAKFERVVLDFLNDMFELDYSNTAISKEGYDDADAQDNLDELEAEATAALEAAGLQEYYFTQVEDY